MSILDNYNTIHIDLKRTEDVNLADECETAAEKKMFGKHLWGGVSGLTCGTDSDTGDILFFFMANELPMKNKNEYVTEYLYHLKKAWKEKGFSIIEERIANPHECVEVGFHSHLFRLKKF